MLIQVTTYAQTAEVTVRPAYPINRKLICTNRPTKLVDGDVYCGADGYEVLTQRSRQN
jgi:hypothetical protein